MRSGLGGQETLNLYAEAIARMPENPGIPPLFRDIFKNAFLPYRDPETLRAFLKVIDEFTYDHSERLGDAFEYLLSVLGSQGDAGQFRTPRHIIDFMVSVVNPKKNEAILDPACGTAGFLISAYKHILKTNTDSKGNTKLSPDERARLADNIRGYDISPDMVRLSIVNLYLHGLNGTNIYEYDTLTSQERWNETADVILANPPFMSPKGGIKPHNRFSVQSKRSEVLFVDYMAEHLNTDGRAGIIVPEGIIFQSQSAYVELRRMLMEKYLVAVISLPSGVFNPDSGVKTSILILDKALARQSSTIAFFKVENDGFGLGAQRREIAKNDLPHVTVELHAYLQSLRSSHPTDELNLKYGLVVTKKKIAQNKDCNLSGERYRENIEFTGVWPMVALGDVTKRISGGTPSKQNEEFWNGSIPWVSPKDMKQDVLFDTEDHVSHLAVERSTTTLVPAGTLLCVVRSGILKHTLPLAITAREMCFNQDIIALVPSQGTIEPRFLFWILKARSTEILETGIKPGVTVQSFHSGFFDRYSIPLPPPEVQKDFVQEIEGYQKVIDGARAVLENYRPHIPIHPDWPMVRLADVCETITDGDHMPPPKADSGIPFVTITNITPDHEIDFSKTFFVSESYYKKLAQSRKPRSGDILYTVTGSYGIPVLLKKDTHFCFQRHIALIRTGPEILNSFLYVLLLSPFMLEQANAEATGVAQKTVSLTALRNFNVPLPPLDEQQYLAAEISAEQALVDANRELITRFERKIQATLARVWGEDQP